MGVASSETQTVLGVSVYFWFYVILVLAEIILSPSLYPGRCSASFASNGPIKTTKVEERHGVILLGPGKGKGLNKGGVMSELLLLCVNVLKWQ